MIATQLMSSNYGFVYFGNREVLEYVPVKRRDDVVYFRPADVNYPHGLNILSDPSAAVDAAKSVWADEWGTLIDGYLSAACASLASFPNGTILAVNRLFLNYEYRQRVLSSITDPGILNYWTDEFSTIEKRDLRQQLQSTLNKIRKLINEPIIRNILGQDTTTFQIKKRTIFIGDFSDLDERTATLLASITLAYLSKYDLPFLLDEPNYGQYTIPRIKQLILTLQRVPDDKSPLRPVVEHARSLCCFRLGLKDAKTLLPYFGRTVKLDDLMDLPPRYAFARTPYDVQRITVPEPIGARRDPTPIINRCRALSPGKVVVEDRLRRFLA